MQNPDIKIPSWDELFMRHVYLIASKSKDESTKIGSILVRDRHVISEGFNGLPIGVMDDIPQRQERPEKYFWFEHAERNSIYCCARFGTRTEGAAMYTQGIPCADCARAVIQGGIARIIVHKQWEDRQSEWNEKWQESTIRSRKMFGEANIEVVQFDMILGIKGLMNGKIIEV